MHGETTHRGRMPREAAVAVERPPQQTMVESKEQQLRQLRRKLEAAVRGEAFEEAARLRDEIRILESKLGGDEG